MLALLRWADNPRNGIAAFRTLQLLPGGGPATADRCLKVFEASGYSWGLLREYRMPAGAADDWGGLAAPRGKILHRGEAARASYAARALALDVPLHVHYSSWRPSHFVGMSGTNRQ